MFAGEPPMQVKPLEKVEHLERGEPVGRGELGVLVGLGQAAQVKASAASVESSWSETIRSDLAVLSRRVDSSRTSFCT